jgi:lysophospholipase L1-like esterase
MRTNLALLLVCALALPASAAQDHAAANPSAGPATPRGPVDWIPFPDSRIELRGLPWFAENSPELWRLPKSAQVRVPKGVWTRGLAPDGGRIRFSAPTSQLAIRVQVVQTQKKLAYFDAYIDAEFAGTAGSPGPRTAELVLFADRDRGSKNITIYLPNTSEVRVLAVAVDAGVKPGPPPPFARPEPLICYGSSVLQGTGSAHPSKTYPAVLARRLNLDFINLGFGGAGKAEPVVVELVNRPQACGFLFDLGKSYGAQPQEPYTRMLAEIRAKHPTVPVFCVTPIYSTKEATEQEYLERSENLRTLMRGAALARQQSGDRNTWVVEGLELFGAPDKDLFNDPLHPNDDGNERMGERLVALVKSKVLGPHQP